MINQTIKVCGSILNFGGNKKKKECLKLNELFYGSLEDKNAESNEDNGGLLMRFQRDTETIRVIHVMLLELRICKRETFMDLVR